MATVNLEAAGPDSLKDGAGVPASWDRSGLPGWSYFNDELLDVEREELFRKHWQVVCHVNDLPGSGDYVAFDIVGERALIIRDKDGRVNAFHNVCRHRGSRVVGDDTGHCKSAIVCPFHGWSYNFDGTLRSPAKPGSLPPLDPVDFGLTTMDMEIWNGFVFVRAKGGSQPPVHKILARFEDEVAPYNLDRLVPAGTSFWTEVSDVNWKSIRDVDNEGYHVPMAHPALHDLFGNNYYDEPFVDGASRSFSRFSDRPGKLWCVRAYKNILPEAVWLPESHRQAWLYIGMFPNAVFGIYPDSVIFYQEFPLSTGRTVQRGAVYRRPDEDRRMRAARYLSGRIDWLTTAEDRMLTIWSCEAAHSSAFKGILLSDLEYGVRTYHDHLRRLFPVLDDDQPPAPGTLAARNAGLVGRESGAAR